MVPRLIASRAHRWPLGVIAAAAGLAALGAADDGIASRIASAMTLVGGGVALLVASIWRARREREAAWWGAVAFSGCISAAGVASWVVDDRVAPLTDPAWAVVYLAAVPFLAATFFVLTFRGLRKGPILRILSDLALIGLATTLTWWIVFVRLTGVTPVTPLALAVPVLDLLVLSAALTAKAYQPERASLDWLVAGVSAALLSDTMIAAGIPQAHSPLGAALGTTATMCLAGFFLTVDADDAEQPSARPRRAIGYLCATAAVAPIVALTLADGGLDPATVFLVVGAVMALIGNQTIALSELKEAAGEKDEALEAMDEALAALSDSEERFRVAFDGAPVGIIVIEHLEVVEVNRALPEIIGLPVEELIGRDARLLVDQGRLPQLVDGEWELLTPTIEGVKAELPWPVPDQGDRWLHVTVARVPGTDTGRLIAIVEDVTQERAATERLADLAVHDPLTRLANRSSFVDELGRLLAQADPPSLAVGFVDLDRFKVINDSLGHVVGDRLLTIVAQRLADSVAGHGTVARFAGDEFTILLSDVDRAQAGTIMQSVLKGLEQPVELDHQMVTYPTGSIGVAFARAGDSPDAMLARADAAMYRAKERGRNRVEFYDGRGDGAAAQLRLMGELHRALEASEFRLHYQPVVDLRSGHVQGVEALLRWQHPGRGLLLPADFVDLAEESGLIVPIGRWVLQEAIGQLARWDQLHPGAGLTMSINLAARQVTNDLVAQVDADLDRTGVEPGRIWLEITESTLMTDTRLASRVLARLRRLGVHITVDDFGTGYSSLTYLQRFPVEGIKLDRSFVDEVGRHAQGTAICEALISLGRALDLHVVAEGVETERQREMLARMGCVLGQGFLFGRPVPAERMTLPSMDPPTADATHGEAVGAVTPARAR